ncbi:MAG: hypothetical protein QW814_00210 [Methanothrix sp.]
MSTISKSSDLKPVSLSVNNITYVKMMRKDEAQAFEERQKLIGVIVPEVKSSFDSLIEKLDSAYINLNVPKTLVTRFISNEKMLYEDFIKPGIEARIGSICKEHINRDSIDIEKVENAAFYLKDRLKTKIKDIENGIGNSEIGFRDVAFLSYETLRKSLAEILEIKTF